MHKNCKLTLKILLFDIGYTTNFVNSVRLIRAVVSEILVRPRSGCNNET